MAFSSGSLGQARDSWTNAHETREERHMDAANEAATALRNPPPPTWPSGPSFPAGGGFPGGGFPGGFPGGGFGNVTLREPSSAQDRINELFAAREHAALSALRAAYDQNVLKLDATRDGIPEGFRDARNQAAAQSEIERQNFREFASARGLNVGAGSQAYLAMSNTLQANLANLNRAEAEATANINLQRAKLEAAYRNDVAQAIADGNMARAQALYNDFVRVDNALVNVSRQQADLNLRIWRANMDAMLAMERLNR